VSNQEFGEFKVTFFDKYTLHKNFGWVGKERAYPEYLVQIATILRRVKLYVHPGQVHRSSR
jgi:hypothetical protein